MSMIWEIEPAPRPAALRAAPAGSSASPAPRKLTPFWIAAIALIAIGAAAAVWILLHL